MNLQHAVCAVLKIRRGVILSAWKLSHRKALKTAVLPAVGMHPVVLMIVLSQGLSLYKREVIQAVFARSDVTATKSFTPVPTR